jgi:hypothetical protein
MFVDLGTPSRGAQVRIRMCQCEMPARGIEQIEVELGGKARPECEAGVVKLHAFGREVIRADDGGVARGVAAAEITLFEHCDIANAMVARQVIRRGKPVASTADDDDFVAILEARRIPEHARFRVRTSQQGAGGELQQAMGHRKASCMRVKCVAHG